MSRATRGFGLLEVIVSATLLLIGLAGVVQFAANAEVVNGHQERVVGAIDVAEATMERLLLLYPDDARLGAGSHTGDRYDLVGKKSPTGLFATAWTCTLSSPVPGARTIEVTVSWSERGVVKTMRLRTIRS